MYSKLVKSDYVRVLIEGFLDVVFSIHEEDRKKRAHNQNMK